MRVILSILLLSSLLSGCAGTAKGDKVSFDRGSFALGYASLISPLLAKCAESKLAPTPECAQLALVDQQVRQAIIDAPKAAATDPMSGLDMNAHLHLVIKLATLAAGFLF